MAKKVTKKVVSRKLASKKVAPRPLNPKEAAELKELRAKVSELEAKFESLGESRGVERRRGFAFVDPQENSMARVIVVAVSCALVLALGAFFLIRGLQWRAALADLKADPGIQVMGGQSVGLLKKRVFGLRDPLAPQPAEVLKKHNISPGLVELELAEYHSLNTPFGRQREEEEQRRIEELREQFVAVVGTLSEEYREKRKNDLARISQLLLELRYPEAMRQLQLEAEDGVWYARGQLELQEYEEFKVGAQKYILDGTLDFANLGNATESRLTSLVAGIAGYNLLERDFDGNYPHVARIARLIRDYDDLCERAGIPEKKLRMVLETRNPDEMRPVASKIAQQLMRQASIAESRIIPEVSLVAGNSQERLSIELEP